MGKWGEGQTEVKESEMTGIVRQKKIEGERE